MKNVIAIAGMPGSGKAVASSVAREYGFPIFVCGDVVREEAIARGLSLTPENLGHLMLKMRREEGPKVIVQHLLPKIRMSESKTIVVEGLRSLDELELLRENFRVTLLAIHSPPGERFRRLTLRGRSDDPKDMEEFVERDRRELEVGIGHVLALADKHIVNDSTIENFKKQLKQFYEGWFCE
ncbi:MAG: AAA family ATPase [Candidatus Bathyarchaeia archaeon]